MCTLTNECSFIQQQQLPTFLSILCITILCPIVFMHGAVISYLLFPTRIKILHSLHRLRVDGYTTAIGYSCFFVNLCDVTKHWFRVILAVLFNVPVPLRLF